MNIINILLQVGAVIPAIIGLILIGNKNRNGFIYNIMSWILFTTIYIKSGLYIMLIIQVAYLVLNIRAYIEWGKHGKEKNQEASSK